MIVKSVYRVAVSANDERPDPGIVKAANGHGRKGIILHHPFNQLQAGSSLVRTVKLEGYVGKSISMGYGPLRDRECACWLRRSLVWKNERRI